MMILNSVALGWLAVVLGYMTAHMLDVSITGSMATVNGVLFGVALLATRLRAAVPILRSG
jgi:manganese/zinc/iron transport system permease protein